MGEGSERQEQQNSQTEMEPAASCRRRVGLELAAAEVREGVAGRGWVWAAETAVGRRGADLVAGCVMPGQPTLSVDTCACTVCNNELY